VNSTSSTASPPAEKKQIDRRLARLRDEMAARDLDAFVSLKLVNTYYLSNFTSLDTARPTTYVRPIVVVVDHTSACLIVPSLDEEPANETSGIEDIRCYSTSPVVRAAQDLCGERLREVGARWVGVEEDSLTAVWAEYLRQECGELEVRFAGDAIARLRLTKGEDEIALVRESARLSDIAIAASLGAVAPGVTELSAETQGIVAFRDAASQDETAIVDCIPIIIGGPRSSMPHEFTSGHALLAGEPMWHCWLTSYRGYWTENIRSGVVGAHDGRFDEVYDCLHKGLTAGQERARPGALARDVFSAVMAELHRTTYPGAVVLTRSGHGMGLEYHEPPFMEASDETVLEPGMVITVEPGIWMPGTGGLSLSNTIVIGEDANEIVTNAPLALRQAE
jgi:Xaa-Pro aminopeptidase